MDKETLLNMGFVELGEWRVKSDRALEFRLDPDLPALAVRADEAVALYAFAEGDRVCYIGKTARSVRRRFVGYGRPGQSQSTNIRCHSRIRQILGSGGEVRVLIFNPITHLRYGDFEIDLAAGLEDALIKAFDPPWNGRDRGRPISEDAEREIEDAVSEETVEGQDTPTSVVASFEIKLSPTYYEKGLVNTGVHASRKLGMHGDPVRVLFGNGAPTVVSSINRTANKSGGARIIGRNQDIARWFQSHFDSGDTVAGEVLDANTIRLKAKQG